MPRNLSLFVSTLTRGIGALANTGRSTLVFVDSQRDVYVGIAASVTGSVAGAIIAFVVTSFVLDRFDDGGGTTLALLAGWVALSAGAGAASYIAAAPFTRNAAAIAFSVFIWTGLLVYPGIVVHGLLDVQPEALVVFGGLFAGLVSAVLVSRIDPA